LKKINFLTSHFLPENTAATNRVVTYVKELSKHYKINIFALGERGEKRATFMKYGENLEVYYINQKNFDAKNFVKRAFFEMSYIYKLISLSKTQKSDLTIATAPYMFMIPLVAFLVRGKKIIDIRDLVWEYLNDKSLFQKVVKIILRKIMLLSLKKYDFILVTNENEKKWLNCNKIVKNICIISNGIEREKFEVLSNIPIKRSNRFTVTYIGNIGIAQNLKVLVECAKELPDISFNIIGSGVEFEELKNYIQKNDIKNVNMPGKKSWSEILEYYEKSSVLYAQLDEKFVSAMPSKLYEYASVGLPIIYGGVGVAADFVKKLENSFSIKPNDKEELKRAILFLKDKNFDISYKNRDFIKNNFIREEEAKKLTKIVDEVLNEGR